MIICGTGHRPNKLGGYGNDVEDRLVVLAMDWCTAYQPDLVISGGALGWDQALAYGAMFAQIPFMLALPFKGFEGKWPRASQDKFKRLMNDAEQIKYVCDDGYAAWKMQKRNEWMVDNSDQVLALWDGSSGGTGNCISYAERVNKPIVNLWETYESVRNKDNPVCN